MLRSELPEPMELQITGDDRWVFRSNTMPPGEVARPRNMDCRGCRGCGLLVADGAVFNLAELAKGRSRDQRHPALGFPPPSSIVAIPSTADGGQPVLQWRFEKAQPTHLRRAGKSRGHRHPSKTIKAGAPNGFVSRTSLLSRGRCQRACHTDGLPCAAVGVDCALHCYRCGPPFVEKRQGPPLNPGANPSSARPKYGRANAEPPRRRWDRC